jgi:electron transport complex protein RnfC
MEHPDEIIEGVIEVMRWLLIPSAIIGIEDNKMPAVEVLKAAVLRSGKQVVISIRVLASMYPQGAEKPLIYHMTGRKVPSGGLPYDVKTLVLNVSTVRFIAKYLHTGMPLVRKRLTLDGGALASPCNVNVPIGALIPDIIAAAGGLVSEPAKIIMGGPMMGVAVDRIDVGIIKANNAILVLNAREALTPSETPCIRCSRCIDSCPMDLLPTSLDAAARKEEIGELAEFHVMDCIECGSCSFVCPAKRHLVQSIRSGKQQLRAVKEKPEVLL